MEGIDAGKGLKTLTRYPQASGSQAHYELAELRGAGDLRGALRATRPSVPGSVVRGGGGR